MGIYEVDNIWGVTVIALAESEEKAKQLANMELQVEAINRYPASFYLELSCRCICKEICYNEAIIIRE
jgi:hypothetical protein